QGRHEQRRQHADDRDDHQQLDECETSSPESHVLSFGSVWTFWKLVTTRCCSGGGRRRRAAGDRRPGLKTWIPNNDSELEVSRSRRVPRSESPTKQLNYDRKSGRKPIDGRPRGRPSLGAGGSATCCPGRRPDSPRPASC